MMLNNVNTQFIPHLEFDFGSREMLGNIGEKADFTALSGEELFVGDVVKFYDSRSKRSRGRRFVCKDKNGFYVMGLMLAKFENGIDGTLKIKKIKSYKNLKNNKKIDVVIAKLKEQEV